MLARRPEGVDLARELGMPVVHPATTSSSVWTHGALRPLPRSVMGVPADVEQVAGSGVLSATGVDRLRHETPGRPLDEGRIASLLGDGLIAKRVGVSIRALLRRSRPRRTTVWPNSWKLPQVPLFSSCWTASRIRTTSEQSCGPLMRQASTVWSGRAGDRRLWMVPRQRRRPAPWPTFGSRKW